MRPQCTLPPKKGKADVHAKAKGLSTVAYVAPSPPAAIDAVVAAIDAVIRKDSTLPFVAQLVDMVVASATATLKATPTPADDSTGAVASIAGALKLQCKLLRLHGQHAELIEVAYSIVALYGDGPEALATVDSGVLAWLGFAQFKLSLYAEALQSLTAVLTSIPTSTCTRAGAGAAAAESDANLKKRIKISQTLVECRRQLGIKSMGDFHKFPRTHHIWDAGGSAVTRDDLLVDDVDFFVGSGRSVIAEEKIDGANVGITVSTDYNIAYQNRSHHVNMYVAAFAASHIPPTCTPHARAHALTPPCLSLSFDFYRSSFCFYFR